MGETHYPQTRGGKTMKKRWIVTILSLVVFFINIPMAANATEVAKPYVDGTECGREIRELKEMYQSRFNDEKISEVLYDQIMEFLETKRQNVTYDNYVEEYNDFPDEYVWQLYRYSDQSIEILADEIWEAFPNEKAVEQLINSYNEEAKFLESEFAIYGIKVNLKVTEEEFPILTAKG